MLVQWYVHVNDMFVQQVSGKKNRERIYRSTRPSLSFHFSAPSPLEQYNESLEQPRGSSIAVTSCGICLLNSHRLPLSWLYLLLIGLSFHSHLEDILGNARYNEQG